MNAKKCKRIRKGIRLANLTIPVCEYTDLLIRKKYFMNPVTNEEGQLEFKKTEFETHTSVLGNCQRRIYKKLKADARQ